MSNVAALGISVDTKDLERFIRVGQQAVQASQKIEGTAEKGAASVTRQSKSFAALQAEIAKMNAALAATAGATASTAKGMDLVSQSAVRQEAALERLTGVASSNSAALAGIQSSSAATATALQKLTDIVQGMAGKTDSSTQAMNRQGSAIDNLRAKFSPAAAAWRQYASALREVDEAEKLGLQNGGIGSSEAAMYRKRLSEIRTADLARIAADEARRNGGGMPAGGGGFLARAGLRPDQGLNLTRQAGDVGTMALMGMSPQSILFSQGFQVAEIFADTERGAKASLKSIGSDIAAFAGRSVAAIGPVGLAFGAVTASVFALGYAFKKELPDAEKTLKAHESILEEIKSRYEGIAEAIERVGQRSGAVIELSARANQSDKEKLLQEEIRLLKTNTDIFPEAGGPGPAGYGQTVRGQFEPLRDFLLEFKNSDSTNILGLVDAISEAAKASDDPAFKKAAEAFIQQSKAAADMAASVREGSTALTLMSKEAQRAAEAVRALGDLQSRMDSLAPSRQTQRSVIDQIANQRRIQLGALSGSANMTGLPEKYADETRRALEELRRSTTDSLADMRGAVADFDLGPVAADLAQTTREYDRQIAESIRLKGDDADADNLRREKALALDLIVKQATRTEEARRAGLMLDIRYLGNLTQAQSAAEAGERAYVAAIADGLGEREARRREEEAYILTLERSKVALGEAQNNRVRNLGRQADEADLQFRLQTTNATIASVTELTTREQLLAAAREANKSIGGYVSPEEVDLIDQYAAKMGALAEATARFRLYQDQAGQLRTLEAEAASIGASAEARRRMVAALEAENALRSANLPLTGEMADAYKAQAVALSDFENRIKRAQSAMDEMRGVGENAIDSIFDIRKVDDFEDAIADIANDLASTLTELAIKNPLKNALFGGGLPTLQDLMNDPGAAPSINAPAIPTQATVGLTPTTAMWVRSADGAAALGGLFSQSSGVPGMPGAANDNIMTGASPSTRAEAYRAAIGAIESRGSGDYAALGPVHAKYGQALGRYQVMESNLPQWSKAALGRNVGRAEFMSNPSIQDAIFDHRFGGYVSKYGERNAAQAWFGGEGSIGKLGRKDVLGTSVGAYGDKFVSELGKLESTMKSTVSSVATTAPEFATVLDQTLNNQMLGGLSSIADQFVPGMGSALQAVLRATQGGGGGGGIFGGAAPSALAQSLSGGFAGLFAEGGSIPSGKWGITGEAGPEIVHGPATVVPMARMPVMSGPSGGQAPRITQTFVNAPNVVSQTEERDENGNINQRIEFENAVAAANDRQGSKANRGLVQRGAGKPMKRF
ncbi:hypothetical protein DYI37_03090 [Fulvimarina endophytica]|uniref:Bacteriophage tail tape measure N-terminal domain-containing protein n=1 Tax=Fulvimarina endophytica TaxID=2293836 RepID=A0A371XB23_9HYPH|nr:phage tail length tape measure family protein [Fulvimarina endophytica]RFC66443.1 hypothetical protein DYI37_03090 [Fulvimarina endophytica]